MGQAIGKNFADAGNDVQYYGSKDTAERLGDIVVMAVPYPALAALAKQYQTKLAGKIVVDITNPLNFETFDELVVPADSSAAQQLQKLLPASGSTISGVDIEISLSIPIPDFLFLN